MAKATDNTRVGLHTVHVQLSVPKSQALADILRGSGRVTGLAEKVLNQISVHADPANQAVPVLTLLGAPTAAGRTGEADLAAEGLKALLRKARAEGHEAAGQLADLAAQLGYTEPAAPNVPAQDHAHELTPAPAPSLT